MQYAGLVRKYSVNRPLTDQERERRLDQKSKLDIDPAYQLGVIRLNSTYMELVDKFFAWKGLLTTFCLIALAMVLYFGIRSLSDAFAMSPDKEAPWLAIAMDVVYFGALVMLLFWLLCKESFAYTHYPIRLNRKRRLVHVFRLDGTVLSVPWDQVFFCIAALPQNDWEIQGHVLDADGITVRETFAFMPWAGSRGEREQLKRYWQFVRRYMEDDLAPIFEHARYVLPINDRRESFRLGLHRTHYDIASAPLLLQLLMFAAYLVNYPGRWIAMQTSKLPVWPQEIEAACRIEAGDPFVRDALSNPAGLRA